MSDSVFFGTTLPLILSVVTPSARLFRTQIVLSLLTGLTLTTVFIALRMPSPSTLILFSSFFVTGAIALYFEKSFFDLPAIGLLMAADAFLVSRFWVALLLLVTAEVLGGLKKESDPAYILRALLGYLPITAALFLGVTGWAFFFLFFLGLVVRLFGWPLSARRSPIHDVLSVAFAFVSLSLNTPSLVPDAMAIWIAVAVLFSLSGQPAATLLALALAVFGLPDGSATCAALVFPFFAFGSRAWLTRAVGLSAVAGASFILWRTLAISEVALAGAFFMFLLTARAAILDNDDQHIRWSQESAVLGVVLLVAAAIYEFDFASFAAFINPDGLAATSVLVLLGLMVLLKQKKPRWFVAWKGYPLKEYRIKKAALAEVPTFDPQDLLRPRTDRFSAWLNKLIQDEVYIAIILGFTGLFLIWSLR